MIFSKNGYDPGIRFFKSPRPLQICFSLEDLQGDGFIRFTFGLLYRSAQLTLRFNAEKYKSRCDWRLFS